MAVKRGFLIKTEKKMSEFERVSQDMFWAVPLHEGDARNKAIDHNLSVHALITAYIADTVAKDKRISWLEEYANAKDVSVTEEMQRANDAEARITELEAQVQELIEELIEELQDVVCFAPECTTSKEYAVKRLEELMNNKREAK